MKKILFAIFCISLAACGNSPESNSEKEDTAQPEKTEISTANEKEEKSISGYAKIEIGDQEFEIEKFRKNKTDVNVTESQATIRLTNAEDNRMIMIGLQGPSVYGSVPATFEPIPTAEGEDKASVTLMGFTDEGNLGNQIILKEGEINLTTFDDDKESPKLELDFEGNGGSVKDFNNENPQSIKGNISIEFDGKIDLRNEQ